MKKITFFIALIGFIFTSCEMESKNNPIEINNGVQVYSKDLPGDVDIYYFHSDDFPQNLVNYVRENNMVIISFTGDNKASYAHNEGYFVALKKLGK